jgi:hypothetical protein
MSKALGLILSTTKTKREREGKMEERKERGERISLCTTGKRRKRKEWGEGGK